MSNEIIGKFMGLPTAPVYRDTGRKDDNGIPVLEGSVIIANGYGKDEECYYCVVYDRDDCCFGSCAYSDFESLGRYQSIIVKGHCEDFREIYNSGEWSGNLGSALKDNPTYKYNSDWNQLMPVVEKIKSILNNDKAKQIFDGYFTEDKNWFTIFFPESIEKLFEEVVDFINWYNINVTKD